MSMCLFSLASPNAFQDIMGTAFLPETVLESRRRIASHTGSFKKVGPAASWWGIHLGLPLAITLWASVHFLQNYSPSLALIPWFQTREGLFTLLLSCNIVLIKIVRQVLKEIVGTLILQGKNLASYESSKKELIASFISFGNHESSDDLRNVASLGLFLWLWNIGVSGFILYKAASVWSMLSLTFVQYFVLSAFFLLTNCVIYPLLWANHKEGSALLIVVHVLYHLLSSIALWWSANLCVNAPLGVLPSSIEYYAQAWLGCNCIAHVLAALGVSLFLHRHRENLEYRVV